VAIKPKTIFMKNNFTFPGNARVGMPVNPAKSARLFALLSALFILLSLAESAHSQTTCCPEFRLKDAIEICPPEGACDNKGGSPDPGHGIALAACKESVHTYTVYPNDLAIYTYNWTITGGTPAAATGNPVNITWGNGGSGIIKVVITGINGCVDSLMHEVCLIEGPKADFVLAPDTVCTNTPVSFTNLSAGGSAYHWDFGDGNTSDLFQPTHSYATAGVYTVFLEVCDAGSGGAQGGELPRACGCCDTVSRTIVVLPGKGPAIETDCCYGTVCPDFTSTFCSPDTCTTYNWTVTGGTIINGAGTNCIEVLWDVSYSLPTTVSLETPGCGPSPCPGITTINVPVLYPNLPINGPAIVCVGESGTFSLPHMPGTYYTWTVAGPPSYNFNTPDLNKANVNITFNAAGSYTVQCVYTNPLAGCSGSSSMVVTVLDVFQIFGPDIVCEGDAIMYTTNGNATWNVSPAGATFSPGPSPNNNIIWNTPGTYVITATHLPAGTFCNPDAYKVVEVIAKPILSAITGPTVACPNKNFTFSVTSNVSDSPFYWSVTSGIVHSQLGEDGEEAIIQLTGAGPWTVSVYQEIEISPGVYCQSLTQSLVVNPYPHLQFQVWNSMC
jgi:PKD repeat protein